ncbi:MAG: hypothetical protein AAFZ18_09120 [Myxococcota bacterium]
MSTETGSDKNPQTLQDLHPRVGADVATRESRPDEGTCRAPDGAMMDM